MYRSAGTGGIEREERADQDPGKDKAAAAEEKNRQTLAEVVVSVALPIIVTTCGKKRGIHPSKGTEQQPVTFIVCAGVLCWLGFLLPARYYSR